MNQTIERIVNLLFEDLEASDETNAIRDEILTNCQERYQDLRNAGMSEDDAIHAVIESLNGMEEMLSTYPRRQHKAAQASAGDRPAGETHAPENEAQREWTCDPVQSAIREIRAEQMGSADIRVCESEDSLIHVDCSNPDVTLITGLENGVLTIALSWQKNTQFKFSMEDGFDLSSLGQMMKKLFSTMVSSAEVTLRIPGSSHPALNLRTASGDVEMEPLVAKQLTIGTASGDVHLDSVTVQEELRLTSASGDISLHGVCAQSLQASCTSGDIEADDCTVQEDVRLNSTSGDIRWSGRCRHMEANAISGDVALEGDMEEVFFKTISGDANATLCGKSLRSVNGKSTSGDVRLTLPEGVQADVRCTSTAGDIRNHAGSVPNAPVSVVLSTTAGDIVVH